MSQIVWTDEMERDFDANTGAVLLILHAYARINRLLVLADTLRWQMHALEKDEYATRSAWDEACATAGVTAEDLKPANTTATTVPPIRRKQADALRAWLDAHTEVLT